MSTEKSLKREMAVYKNKIKEWEGREGEFVLIKGEDVCGFFSSYDDALKNGYEKFQLKQFLVKQVSGIEDIHYISREFYPCHTLHSR